MPRLISSFIIIALITCRSIAQESELNLVIGQNVYLPGQYLWYGVNLKISTGKIIDKIKHYPSVHITLSDLNNQVIYRGITNNRSSSITSNLYIPKESTPGTYILSATTYNQDLTKIIEEQAIPIHILGNKNDLFSSFADHQICATNATGSTWIPSLNTSDYKDDKIKGGIVVRQYYGPVASSTFMDSSGIHQISQYSLYGYQGLPISAKVRISTCFESIISSTQSLVMISNSAYLIGYDVLSFKSVSKDSQYGYTKKVFVDPRYSMPGFYDSNQNQIYQFKRTGLNGENFMQFPFFETEKQGQYLDLITKEIISNIKEIYPTPWWTCQDLIPLAISKSHFDSLQSKLEKSELISRIFDQVERPAPIKKPITNQVVPDHFIDLAHYQLFENIELFLVEAVDPVKVVKTKGKPVGMRLLRDDVKMYYTESPLLIMNGKIYPDARMLFDVPYREISSLSIFRGISSTRKAFGPLGRFGVISVITKPSYKMKSDSFQYIKGFDSAITYLGNNAFYPSDSPMPRFSSIQFFGSPTQIPFCFIPNDEKGMYLMQVLTDTNRQSFSFGVQ